MKIHRDVTFFPIDVFKFLFLWETVVPEARGKGIGTQMSLYPLKDGLDAGYKLGVLHSTDMGYSI